MTELNGAEWKAFYSDEAFWPEGNDEVEGRVHDDVLIHLNGSPSDQMLDDPDSIKDSDKLVIESGYVATDWMEYIDELDAYFESWRKQQDTVTFVVRCNPKDLDAVKSAVKNAGGDLE